MAKKSKGKFLSCVTQGEITIKIRVNHYDDGSKELLIPDDAIPILKKIGNRRGRPSETQAEFLQWVAEGIRRCDEKMHLQENQIYLQQERLAEELECDASYLSARMNMHGIKSQRGLLWLAVLGLEGCDDIWAIGLDQPESPANIPVNYLYSRNPQKELAARKRKKEKTT